MAVYNKFNVFVADLIDTVHDLLGTTPGTDCEQLQIYLSNATPDAAADAVKADLAEITNENGYSGPINVPNQAGEESTGTVTVSGDEIQITASGGSIGPFQYVVLFNSGTAAKTNPLVSWWDNGETVTLSDGESFTWQPSGQASGGTIFTLS